jgi:hypothetical protein
LAYPWSEHIKPVFPLSDWLRNYNDQPWRRYVAGLEQREELVNVDGVIVDGPALFSTRFRCDSKTCAMPDRPSGIESCCQEYYVNVTLEERDRIVARADDVIELLSRKDPRRVKPDRKIESFFDDRNTIELAKEDNRCAFSYRDDSGQLWCGLHSLAVEKNWPIDSIKPVTCSLFPLVVFRFENGDVLLTANTGEVERMFAGTKESLALPCLLKQAGDPMYVECRGAIELAFGREFYERLARAAAQFEHASDAKMND